MRFKISSQGSLRHTQLVACVAWSSADEFYSCGEDHRLLCWHLEGGSVNSSLVTEFPSDFFATSMQWHPRSSPGINATMKQSLDVLLITTADGKFHLVNKNGRIEKSVNAHKGATLYGKWSYDGSALFTAGEDGLVKIWSRSGMLRSTAIRNTQPILSASWSPDCAAILYSQGSFLLLQSLTSNTKPNKWHAHDGLILTIAWNQCTSLIVSGGEDCKYKVWDQNGNLLYNSVVNDHPITALSWCYSGSNFAVGSFNTIKLCDKTGWTHSLEKMNTGSIYCIDWSSDGTQVAIACGSGAVFTAHTIDKAENSTLYVMGGTTAIIANRVGSDNNHCFALDTYFTPQGWYFIIVRERGRRLEWNNYEAVLVRRKAVEVTEIGSERREILEISDRVVQLEFGYEHLVVITPTQCHVYSVTNWNTPAIFDLKNGSISAVILAESHFLLVEWNILTLYNYQGRLLGIPKWKGMSQEPFYAPCISLCSDTLVVRNQSNSKLIHVLEISQNRPMTEGQSYSHFQDVHQLALNQLGSVRERQLAIVDSNRDLFLVSVRASGFGRVCKIAVMAHNIAWAKDANVLAAMLDATLSVWLCPNCVHYSDRQAIRKTRIDRENSEYGKQPSIVNVHNGKVTVRRGDGALVVTSFYTLFTSLHHHILNNKWSEAVSLCRIAQNDILWTCMAVLAIDNKELTIAEEACTAIDRYDKVEYIQYIKKLPNRIERLAETALLAGDLLSAEGILLQNGLIAEAIRINIEVYSWNRALELAIKHKVCLDEVLEARKMYLKIIDKKETNQNYLSYQEHVVKMQNSTKDSADNIRPKSSESRKSTPPMKMQTPPGSAKIAV